MLKKQKLLLIFIILLLTWYNFSVYSPDIKTDESIKIIVKKIIKNKDTIINEKPTEVIPKIIHLKTPSKVKSIYYTSYSASREIKIKSLINLVKNTEINSVIIDIKTISWYVSFKMNENNFTSIKPISNNKNKIIKKLIKELHKNNIYVIARVVVFKDKSLSERRSDLAIKRKDNWKVWSDYKWKKYLDPNSQEVWDYNVSIASEAYNIGFDEINFDYVRFPSDWYISNTYYTFSNKIIKENPKYWRVMIIDKFSNYITTKLKEKYPKIVLSADVFWLVTKYDMLSIWQSLESFVLNFDYVWPMVYPSHYWKWYLGFNNPDNYPYEIIKDSLFSSNKKIDKLNNDIKKATASWAILKIKNIFIPKANIQNIWEISKNKIRPWLQWFSCTWCKNYIPYDRVKFRKQIKALEDSNLNSWFIWNSASNYYIDWYNKN